MMQVNVLLLYQFSFYFTKPMASTLIRSALYLFHIRIIRILVSCLCLVFPLCRNVL